jgi:type II secretory pathway component GspD/PulD (secretin)
MTGKKTTNGWGNARRQALCLLAPAVMGLSLLTLGTGCASKPKPQPEAVRHEGTLNPPVVISGKPARDTRALLQADDQLSEADWKVLEKLGPRPIWEQIDNRAKRSRADVAPVLAEPGTAVASANDLVRPGISSPTTRPVNEAELPVQVIPLADNKVRMIWTLRAYGGTNVASPRNGGTTRRDVTLTPPDLTPLVTVVTQHVGQGGTVTPLPRENTLVITCGQDIKQSTLDLLNRLDVAPRQVEITARIFEVSQDFDFQQGANLLLNRLASDGTQSALSTFSAKRFAEAAAAGTGPANGSVMRIMQTFGDAGISVDVTFQLLQETGLIKVVSSPRMTVAVGQTGYMLAGQEIPIQSANLHSNVIQTTTTYKPVGVQLYITPQAISNDSVKLHTISIVSAVNGFAPLPTLAGGTANGSADLAAVNPIIDSREAETQVTIQNGDTLVISGLRMVRSTSREEKIPGLGEMPGLGWLFKNHRTQQQMTDLYFFVTPALL